MIVIPSLFHLDPLSMTMITLISFVSFSIAFFAWRHLAGDRKQAAFYRNLIMLVMTMMTTYSYTPGTNFEP